MAAMFTDDDDGLGPNHNDNDDLGHRDGPSHDRDHPLRGRLSCQCR
jgi:hypothetical protein